MINMKFIFIMIPKIDFLRYSIMNLQFKSIVLLINGLYNLIT
jgi:hypothetical protein